MIVHTMSDEEILSEFWKELNDGKGIIWKIDYWITRTSDNSTFRNNLFEKAKKEGKVTYNGYLKGLAIIDPIVITTKMNNIVVSYNFIHGTGGIITDKNVIQGNYFKIPISYEYKPKKGKGGVKRNGYHYFKLAKTGKSITEHLPSREYLIRITSHVLDRLYQRSNIFKEKVISLGISNIQAFSLFDNPLEGPICCSEDLVREVMLLEEEVIKAECTDPRDFEFLMMVKRGFAYKKFLDGYLVYNIGIVGKTIPTFITFLTEQQLSDKLRLAEIEKYALFRITEAIKNRKDRNEFEEFEEFEESG